MTFTKFNLQSTRDKGCYRLFSTDTSTDTLYSATIKVDDINQAYNELLNHSVNHVYTRKVKLQPFTTDQYLTEVNGDIDTSSIQLKKFCSDIRVSTESSFNRNIVELLLLPISKSISINEDILHLKSTEPSTSLSNYKRLVSEDSIRNACINYIHSVLEKEQEIIISSETTLKSFRKNTLFMRSINNWKLHSDNLHDRHVLLAIFLSVLLFEVVHNNTGKRSKSRIINYLIDRLAKSKHKK